MRINVTAESYGKIAATVAELHQLAQKWFAEQASRLSERAHYRVEADMRYAGQAYELSVTLGSPASITHQQLLERFQQLHQQRYGFNTPDAAIELTTLRLSLNAALPRPTDKPFNSENEIDEPVSRPLYLRGAWVNARIWQRVNIGKQSHIHGPAVIEQEDTTTLILPGWSACTDSSGNLLIARVTGDAA
nr:hypothetical protein [Pantoea sp. DY-15]